MMIEFGKPIEVNGEPWDVVNAEFESNTGRGNVDVLILTLRPYDADNRPTPRKKWIAYVLDENAPATSVEEVVKSATSLISHMRVELSYAIAARDRLKAALDSLSVYIDNLGTRFKAAEHILSDHLRVPQRDDGQS